MNNALTAAQQRLDDALRLTAAGWQVSRIDGHRMWSRDGRTLSTAQALATLPKAMGATA